MILDFFGGSGSTLIAAERTNRHAYLMELDPKYCDVIIERWQNYTGKEALHQQSQKLFKELQQTQKKCARNVQKTYMGQKQTRIYTKMLKNTKSEKN